MAKKKSKRFIIPSIHFLTSSPPVVPQPTEQGAATASANPAQHKTQPAPAAITRKRPDPEPVKQVAPKKPEPLTLDPSKRRNSALSLSSLKRNKEAAAEFQRKQQKTTSKKDLPKDPFTEAQFFEVWHGYVNGLHEKGEKILSSILKADVPKLKGHLIHVAYPNELMKVELLKVRPKVLRHIRKALNNYDIDFEITVNEEHTKRFAYTPQEKYELLKEKNAALALLRKKFNLEL